MESWTEIDHWVAGVIFIRVSRVGKRRRFRFVARIRWAGIVK